jgi:hypothetical protein
MAIGRDHISSTVYTIVFAYAGAALPLLMLFEIYQRPLWTTLTGAEIGEEIVRTLVGVIALVLSVPITTAVGALLATATQHHRPATATTGFRHRDGDDGGARRMSGRAPQHPPVGTRRPAFRPPSPDTHPAMPALRPPPTA